MKLLTGLLVVQTLSLAVDIAYAQDEGDLRLVGGTRSGRLEIYLLGQWGTVCDDFFGTTEGNVACRQLGYDSATSVGNVGQLGFSPASFFTQIWLDNVDCSSSDTTLLSCNHRGIGIVDGCTHSEDVALVCFGSRGSSSSSSDDSRDAARVFVGIFWGSLTVTIILPIGLVASIICFIAGAGLVVSETQGHRNITREAPPPQVVITEMNGMQQVTELSKLSPHQAPPPVGPTNPGPSGAPPPAGQHPPANQKAPPPTGQRPPANQKAPPSTGQRPPANQKAPPPAAKQTLSPASQQAPPLAAKQAPPPAAQKAPPQKLPPLAGQRVPPLGGQQAPPSAGQQPPPPAGQRAPSHAGQRAPPSAGQRAPPRAGQRAPPSAGQQPPPSAGQRAPPSAGQRAPPPAGPQPPPRAGQQAGPPPQGPTAPQRQKKTTAHQKPPGQNGPPKPKPKPTMI